VADSRRSDTCRRTELISERVGLTNRIGAVLATLGVSDYNPLLRNRSRRLTELRTALGEPLPANAHANVCLLGWNWYSRRSLSWSASVTR
jgi:transposase